ncbi:hypothetical protein AURDEDRAFT_183534 [Auricularia subglabra TFB-10046 SS5]|nr:hypothetical protein AURDEDRAFT_183534 [Auricularia subglabra TFB-10046 SS5]
MDPPAGQPGAGTNADAQLVDAQDTDAQRSRGGVSGFLFLAFLFFLFGGGSRGDDLLTRHQLQESLQSLIYQQSNYSAFLKNETSNFTLHSFGPELGPFVQSYLPAPTKPRHSSLVAYYQNLTGFATGSARFYNLSTYGNDTLRQPWVDALMKPVNLTDAARRRGDWDWRSSDRIVFSVLENRPVANQSINMVHGKIDLTDRKADRTIRFTLEGVHYPLNGSLYGLVEARGRQPDLRHILGLVPEDVRNSTGPVIDAELVQRIDRLRTMIAGSSLPDMDTTDDSVVTTCPFSFQAQLHPAAVTARQMEELEGEMDQPTGITTVRRPPLLIDAVFVSPKCGIVLHLEKAKGLKSQRYWRKVINYAGMASLAYLSILVVLVREMARCQTPAMLSRIGRPSIVMQTCLDAFSFTAHLTFSIVADNKASMPLIAPGFLACILLMFQMQFSNSIYEVQGPEEANNPTPAPGVPESQPAPATLPQRLRAAGHTAILYTRMFSAFFLLVGAIAMGIWLMFDTIRAGNFLLRLAHYVFWLPQIIRNVRRNARMALSWEYILVVSAARLFFLMYIFACPENVLGVEPTAWAQYIPWAFGVQLVVLLAQDMLGPTFFLPKGWVAADVYDYHPPLPMPDAEAPETSLGDCAICMDTILALPDDATTRVKSGLLAGASVKRHYALAPCNHLFHTECLERWLAIKNICPQCRRPLPPL